MNSHASTIDELARSGESFRRAAEAFSPSHRREKPTEKAFSATEIVYHMVDVEHLWQRRIDDLLSGASNTFTAMDPDAVARDSKYNEKDYEAGLSLLSEAREASLKLFASLNDEDFMREGMHTRYGPMSIVQVVEKMIGHDKQHEAQLARTLTEVTPAGASVQP